MLTPSHRLEGESLRYAPALHGQRYCGAMQPKPSAVWNTPRAGDAWQIRHIKSKSDTMKPGLDYKSRSGFIHVILIENQFTERS